MKSLNQSLALALLAGFATSAIAEDDPVLNLITPSSSVSLGMGYLGGERQQFGMYDDVTGNQAVLLFDADITEREDATGTWWTLSARNVGIDSRVIDLGYETQGDWGLNFDYSKIPYNAPYTINSGISGFGETQTVPGAAYVPGTGSNIHLGTDRDRTGLQFFKYLNREVKITLGFRNEEKAGERHWGRGGQPEFAVEPIDSTNQIFDALMDYVGKDLQLTGGYTGTWYRNDYDLVHTFNGTNDYYLSLPLNSEAHQFFMNGGVDIASNTRATFRLSYTYAEVDEHLPTADIPGLAWNGVTLQVPSPGYPAAPTQLEAGLNTSVIFLGLTSRPLDHLSLVANVRYYEVDESTPPDLIVCSNCGDANAANNTLVHSTPLDYKTFSGKVEGTYTLPRGYSVIAGVDIREQDRTTPYGSDQPVADGLDDQRYVPFRADLDETTYKIQLRKSLSDTVNGWLGLSHAERDGSNFTEAVHSEPGEGIEPEAINPINISDRERDKVRATVDWAPLDPLSLQFNYEIARDDYSGHSLGLTDGDAQIISIDVGYALSEDFQLSAWVSHDETEAEQHNHRFASGTYSEADMFDTLRDTGDSVGLNLDWTINERTNVGLDVEWTLIESEYDQDLVPLGVGTLYETGTTGPLPDIESTATRAGLFLEYALAENSGLRFDLTYEYWKTDDWTWEFSGGTPFIYGSTLDGTRVTADSHQTATFGGLRYYYNF